MKGGYIMKYREFLSLTDEEIRFILTDIFHPIKIENIQRDKEFNEITEEVVLSLSSIDIDFSLDYEDQFKWRKFLLAKGCDERLKDNPYLEE